MLCGRTCRFGRNRLIPKYLHSNFVRAESPPLAFPDKSWPTTAPSLYLYLYQSSQVLGCSLFIHVEVPALITVNTPGFTTGVWWTLSQAPEYFVKMFINLPLVDYLDRDERFNRRQH